MRRLVLIIALLIALALPGLAADPSSISGLDGWWRADAGITLTSGRVSQWNDQTSNAYNLTQATAANQPAYVPGDVRTSYVAFEEYTPPSTYPQPFLTIPNTLVTNQQAFSFFMVVDWQSMGNTNGGNTCIIYGQNGGTGALLFMAGGTLHVKIGGVSTDSGLRITSSRCVIGVSCNGTNTTVYSNYNTATLATMTTGSFTGGLIGSYNAGAQYNMTANVRAMYHFSRAISMADYGTFLDYCAGTYGVNYQPTINIAADGDSMTAGSGASLNLSWLKLLGLPSNYRVTNWGVPSQQLATMITNYSTNVAPIYSSAYDYNVLVVLAGTNDVVSTGGNVTGATAYSRLVTYCQAAQATGWKVIVCTMLPRPGNGGSGGSFETDRTTFNNSVKANWSTFANAIVDTTSDANLGVANANTNLMFFASDQIHPNSTGYALLDRYIYKAINSIVNPSTIIPSPSRF